MRKIAFVLALLPMLAACQGFGWSGKGGGLSEREREAGLQDPKAMATAYSNSTYWGSVRRKWDGRTNAFGRDLGNITNFIDRYFFNYSATDPYINFPTEETMLTHTGMFVADNVAGRVPVIDDINRR